MSSSGVGPNMASPLEFTSTVMHGWKGICLAAGDVSVGLVPDIGGRIMSLAFRGEELLYVHLPEAGRTFDFAGVGDIIAFKNQFGFRLFGGDKTWVAPEPEWQCQSPPVELDAGRYAFFAEGGGCRMVSPVCRETGLRIVRRVALDPDGTVRLEEELENTTGSPLLKGIWNVTQVSRPLDVYVAAGPSDLRSYHLQDPSLTEPGQPVTGEGAWAKVSCWSSVCFKFGGMPRAGRVFMTRPGADGILAFAREFGLEPGGTYAHGSAVEVFNSAQYPYAEIEVHAPLRAIPPGGRVAFRQAWRLRSFPAGTGAEQIGAQLFPFA